MPGASVTAIDQGNGQHYTATTSDQGVFTFAQLPVGRYEIHVKQASFKDFVERDVEVHTSTPTE